MRSMISPKLAIIITFGVTLLSIENAYARGSYLDWWAEFYPFSSSGDMDCQLCHQQTFGQNGWNQYGWAIRPRFLANQIANGGMDRQALEGALQEVESLSNPDSSDGLTFLDEIRYSTQPGWVDDNVNTVNFRPDEPMDPPVPPLEDQNPPALPINAATEIDLTVSAVAVNPLPDIPTGALEVELHTVASEFNAPVKAVRAPGINGSLFVVEQTGKIIRVDLTTGVKNTFLNVSGDLTSGGNERGLLGLAFHPNFVTNGLFYTYQSEPQRPEQDAIVDFTTTPNNPNHRSMVVEYKASDPSCNSLIQKQRILMIVDQPQSNHNGGDLAFDQNGLLYISIGDGGSADDQGNGHGVFGNSRDNSNVLGTILRIDPDGNNSANGQYGIPNDNPFAGVDGVDEIFAYGLRNPYRMSFDSATGDLYTGDVGQRQIEEINRVVRGGNYGWNWKEGSFFFIDPDGQEAFLTSDEPPGVPDDLLDPLVEYDHDEGVSAIGGNVYRGNNIPGLAGNYVFADYRRRTTRRLMYFDTTQGTPTLNQFIMTEVSGNVTGFGKDAEGELYIVTNPGFSQTNTEGTLQKIQAPSATYTPPDSGEESALCPGSDEICVPIKATNGNISVICL